MNKREAMAYVCHGVATHMDNQSENAWLELDHPADTKRVQAAFDRLMAELRRRGEPARPRR